MGVWNRESEGYTMELSNALPPGRGDFMVDLMGPLGSLCNPAQNCPSRRQNGDTFVCEFLRPAAQGEAVGVNPMAQFWAVHV